MILTRQVFIYTGSGFLTGSNSFDNRFIGIKG